MFKFISLLFKYSGRVLIGAFILYFTNVIAFSFVNSSNMSWQSFTTALRISTAYIMGRESPRVVAATVHLPLLTELLGWALCILGWFLVPLFIGKLVY